MAQFYESISDAHKVFIEAQRLFFCATAAADGRINLSPKGIDSLRVLDANHVLWANLSGSGNETAAHLLELDRMTLMFCSFEDKPGIMRLFAHATACHPGDKSWSELSAKLPAMKGIRQILDLRVYSVQTSCGFGVPLYEYRGQRRELTDWADKRSPEEIDAYWRKKNHTSIDGKPTGIANEAP